MRLRVRIKKIVVHPGQHGVLARGQVVQGRVLDGEVALAHRALDVNDGMAGRAAQPRLRLRRVDLLLDRPVEAAVEEDGVVVAARAPLRGPRAHDVLHVLDRPAVPLVVEGREVVGGGGPLLVDLLVAAGAGVAGHEEVGRDRAAHVGLRGGREEGALRAAAFAVHAVRGQGRVRDAIALRGVPVLPHDHQRGRADHDGHDAEGQTLGQPLARARATRDTGRHPGQHEQRAQRRHDDVGAQQPRVRARRAHHRKGQSRHRRQGQQRPRPDQGARPRPPTRQLPGRRGDEKHAQQEVEDDASEVEERRVRVGRQVRAVGDEDEEPEGELPHARSL